MNGQQAWNQIKDKFNKGGYTKIRLAVCEAGKDDASGRSLADDLAAWSGKPVEATRNEVGYPINGQVFIGSPVPGYIPPQTVPIPNAQWEQFP